MPHALIVDDNAKNVDVLARLLAMEGVTATRIGNPTHLPQTLTNISEVDVVFLDLEMPGQDGYQILEMLKADARFSTTPIVAYTVHVSEITVAHKLGFHSFLGKPLDSDKFPDQLAAILRGESVWSAGAN
jgi:two-component system, cell cycle response regulator DivK